LEISRRSSGDRRKSDASFNKRNPRGKWATVTITGIIGVYKNIENDIWTNGDSLVIISALADTSQEAPASIGGGSMSHIDL